MNKLFVAAMIASFVYAVVKTKNVKYSPCSQFLDSPEGQEYMRRIREWSEQHKGEKMPERVRRRIMDEILGRI